MDVIINNQGNQQPKADLEQYYFQLEIQDQ